ncbi:hypothetical protein KIPB_013843, partial [Kipferlia bialata]
IPVAGAWLDHIFMFSGKAWAAVQQSLPLILTPPILPAVTPRPRASDKLVEDDMDLSVIAGEKDEPSASFSADPAPAEHSPLEYDTPLAKAAKAVTYRNPYKAHYERFWPVAEVAQPEGTEDFTGLVDCLFSEIIADRTSFNAERRVRSLYQRVFHLAVTGRYECPLCT